ncbi:hypothetical protein TUM4438_32620 [Shewanella sairae]|uniref:Uncharacterized protein n=1 Tax=Shewanella sairae TaxID=190310 RepID=A0ABQ4PM70_9GAMM|nr:hypothetical protein TUM4438_32620 [Shewanella sairae]
MSLNPYVTPANLAAEFGDKRLILSFEYRLVFVVLHSLFQIWKDGSHIHGLISPLILDYYSSRSQQLPIND